MIHGLTSDSYKSQLLHCVLAGMKSSVRLSVYQGIYKCNTAGECFVLGRLSSPLVPFTGHRGGCSQGSWRRCPPSRAAWRAGRPHDSPAAPTGAEPQTGFLSLRDAARHTGRLCSPVEQRTKQETTQSVLSSGELNCFCTARLSTGRHTVKHGQRKIFPIRNSLQINICISSFIFPTISTKLQNLQIIR